LATKTKKAEDPDHPRRRIEVKVCVPGGLQCVVLYISSFIKIGSLVLPLWVDLKHSCAKWNGHNAFAHPLKFDELLRQSHFSSFLYRIKISYVTQIWKNAWAAVSESQFRKKVDIISLCSQPSKFY